MNFDDFMDMLSSHRSRDNMMTPPLFAISMLMLSMMMFLIAVSAPNSRWFFILAGIGCFVPFALIMVRIMTLKLFTKIMFGVSAYMFLMAFFIAGIIGFVFTIIGIAALVFAILLTIKIIREQNYNNWHGW